MDVSEAQRLKALDDENRRLKHLVADLSLDKEMLNAVIRKTAGACRFETGCGVREGRIFSERTPARRNGRAGAADAALWVSAPACYVDAARAEDQRDATASAVPGRRACSAPAKKRLSLPAASSGHHVRRNQEWAIDFVADTIGTGRGIRVLAVVDAITRECLGLGDPRTGQNHRTARNAGSSASRRDHERLDCARIAVWIALLAQRVKRIGVRSRGLLHLLWIWFSRKVLQVWDGGLLALSPATL
ncbi:MAG: transposase family protein [Bryobacterales bacterium]|nr:transposase family protein [Bryobacterales bacterium]